MMTEQKNFYEVKIEKNIDKKLKKEEEKIKEEITDLKKRFEEMKILAEERLNSIKYLQADFDNYRKNFEKEKEKIIELANENLIRELIIVLDDFDAAIRLSDKEEFREGLVRLKKKFFDILAKHGLKEIEALGKKFNPEFHEVLCEELSKHNEEEVIEEIQKGYLLKSKLIRASKVKIARNKEKIKENKEVN